MLDVVVVGGGPAGSVSAMLLARAGFEVTLLERQFFPRAKPCGDCLSPGANVVLKRLDVWDDIVRAGPACIPGWQLTSPGHISFQTRFCDITPDPDAAKALAISRDRLDAVLLRHARSAGVDVREGMHVIEVLRASDRVYGVRVQDGNHHMDIKARLTIGADGLRSIIARRLNAYAKRRRLRKASFTMHLELNESRVFGEMHVSRNACLGVAPVESNGRRHNVTLVLNHGSFAGHAGVREIVRAGLQRFGFEQLPDHCDEILTSGPFDWPNRQIAFDGALLVGDAAGYYDPFTGQGIYQALRSAELLAEHASQALHARKVTRKTLQQFERAQRHITQPARRVQRIIEFVCARPHLADRVFEKFSREQAMACTLLGVTGDLLPAARLLSPRLLARLAV